MSTPTTLAAWAAALLGGCTLALGDRPGGTLRPCRKTSECPSGMVCFTEGCATPKTGLAIEVRPADGTQLLPQDQPLAQIDTNRFEVQLKSNATVAIRVETGVAGGPVAPFSGGYALRADGRALSVPSVTRSFKSDANAADSTGTVKAAVSPAVYALELLPTDAKYPPAYGASTVLPGTSEDTGFLLPPPCQLKYVNSVIRTATNPDLPGSVRVQAIERLKGRPLSQVTTVRPYGSGGNQQFVLCTAQTSAAIDIVVSPASSDVPVPTVRFQLDRASSGPLEMGEFGDPVRVRGRVLRQPASRSGLGGLPVGGAAVWFQGPVNPVEKGGTFRSATVTTDLDGYFTASTLPSAQTFNQLSSFSVFIQPPPSSDDTAAATIRGVEVTPNFAETVDFTCNEKITVSGTVYKSNHQPLQGVVVAAEATPLTLAGVYSVAETATATSNEAGDYVLRLNEGQYRFSFQPRSDLPRSYLPPRTIAAGEPEVYLPPVVIPAAIAVSGQLLPPTGFDLGSVTGATVEVYAVPSDRSPAVLVSRTKAGDGGQFTVFLPAIDPIYSASSAGNK